MHLSLLQFLGISDSTESEKNREGLLPFEHANTTLNEQSSVEDLQNTFLARNLSDAAAKGKTASISNLLGSVLSLPEMEAERLILSARQREIKDRRSASTLGSQ